MLNNGYIPPSHTGRFYIVKRLFPTILVVSIGTNACLPVSNSMAKDFLQMGAEKWENEPRCHAPYYIQKLMGSQTPNREI